MVVDPPNETFMMEAWSLGLCRWVDALFVGGLELEDSSFVDEARESLFEDPSGGERLDGSPLSLYRDLRGGIGEGLGGHVAVMLGELGVEVERASGALVLRVRCTTT